MKAKWKAAVITLLIVGGLAFPFVKVAVLRVGLDKWDGVLVAAAFILAAWLHNSAPVIEAVKAWVARKQG